MKGKRTGHILLTSAAALTTVGGFLADWNETHLFNPRWTPHAKFHDALTILLGSMLGASGLYLLRKKAGDQQMQLRWGTLLPAFFWAAQAGSCLRSTYKSDNTESHTQHVLLIDIRSINAICITEYDLKKTTLHFIAFNKVRNEYFGCYNFNEFI